MDEAIQLNRRARDRVATDIRLTCRVPAAPVSARVLDLSDRGCRVVLANTAAERGATILLDFADGERVTGEVIWAAASYAGVRFHRPMRKQTAVFLGIAEPEPVAVTIEPAEIERPQSFLSHWFRRLGRFR